MCLDTVTAIYENPKQEEGSGWKVFRKAEIRDLDSAFVVIFSDYAFRNMYSATNGSGIRRKFNVWYEADLDAPLSRIEYPLGFHIFLDKKAAEDYMLDTYKYFVDDDDAFFICEVKYNEVVAEGIQSGGKCVVARKMMAVKGK